MTALLIKNLPSALHKRLRQQAHAHHRSMNREIIAILEQELMARPAAKPPPPLIPLDKPVDGGWVTRIIRDARDGKQ